MDTSINYIQIIDGSRQMTTQAVADTLKTSVKVILENAKKVLPNKKIEQGKVTFWSEAEVALIKDRLLKNENGNYSMTLQEVANITGAAYSTIAAYAQKAGWTHNGVVTRLNKFQVTAIVEAMKSVNNNQYDLPSRLEGIETSLTPALKAARIKSETADLSLQERIRLSFEIQAGIITELEKENIDLRQYKDNTNAINKARHNRKDLWARIVKGIQKYAYEKGKDYSEVYVRAYKELSDKYPNSKIKNKQDIINNTDLLCDALEIIQGWQ